MITKAYFNRFFIKTQMLGLVSKISKLYGWFVLSSFTFSSHFSFGLENNTCSHEWGFTLVNSVSTPLVSRHLNF
jgi:hypothetical protein